MGSNADGKKESLRILMLAPTPFFSDRGCHVRIHEEAEALRRRGHQVGIVTYHLGRDVGDGPVWRIPRVPWYSKTSAGPSWHKPYLDLLLFFKALKVSRAWQPDIIHAHLHEGALVAKFLKFIIRKPILFDCQGSLTEELQDHQFVRSDTCFWKMFSWVEGWVNNSADHVVCSSAKSAKNMRERFLLPPQKVSALIDAIPPERPGSNEEIDRLRKKLCIPEDVPLVVYLGVMTEYQGVGRLLEAISLLNAKGSPGHFLLMGFPDRVYRQRAIDLEIDDRITFTGKVPYENIMTYLSLGSLAVSPKISKTEANGKIFNYMAASLPVVVFDNEINREILAGDGCYAEYDNVQSLADQMLDLMIDGDKRKRMSDSLSIRSLAQGWDERIEELLEIYERITNGNEDKIVKQGPE